MKSKDWTCYDILGSTKPVVRIENIPQNVLRYCYAFGKTANTSERVPGLIPIWTNTQGLKITIEKCVTCHLTSANG